MAAAVSVPSHSLRVAAIWGTTVVGMRTLKRGESFVLGEEKGAVLPIPDGVDMSPVPVRAAQGTWELDTRGVVAGILKLRGRDEDPTVIGRSGAPIPIMPGDYGLLQYGQFGIFFQYTTSPQPIAGAWAPELLVGLALLSSGVLHAGMLGLLRALMTPPPIAKPLELTNPEEYAARFGLKRAVVEPEPPQPVAAGEKQGGQGVKDPGAEDKKKQGGGQKMKGDEGKLGLKGDKSDTQLPGDVKPAVALGGISDVLSSEEGKEVKKILQSVNDVSEALGAMNSKELVLGSGPGTAIKGAGSGGGGTGAGVPFGCGTLNTGWGAGSGGGYGSGSGGPGGRGTGGHGGGGSGSGAGSGVGERGVGMVGTAVAAPGGLSAEQIRRVVLAHQGALRACYDSELARNPGLKGGVTMQWQIEPGGTVTSASVASSTLSNPRVEGCISRQVKSWKFPSAGAPTSVTAFPFKFGVGGG
jgi:hypothetical protein